MTKDLDILFDKNLKLIYESHNQEMFANRFLDINDEELTAEHKGDTFANFMHDEGLIINNRGRCVISRKGNEIQENGGWLKHLKRKHSEDNLSQLKEIQNELRDDRLKNLQIENLEYKEKNRILEEELKISSLLKNWFWLISTAIATGITIGGYLVSIS